MTTSYTCPRCGGPMQESFRFHQYYGSGKPTEVAYMFCKCKNRETVRVEDLHG